jgi:hypothetical protein
MNTETQTYTPRVPEFSWDYMVDFLSDRTEYTEKTTEQYVDIVMAEYPVKTKIKVAAKKAE